MAKLEISFEPIYYTINVVFMTVVNGSVKEITERRVITLTPQEFEVMAEIIKRS